MRTLWLATIALGVGVGCSAPDPVRGLTVREARLVRLDSLARHNRCDTAQFRLLYDPAAWRPAHACAVASRALALVAAAPPNEPYFAPGDTARVRAVAIWRQQGCQFRLVNDQLVGGRLDSLLYMIEIEATGRDHSILVGLDAERLLGHVEHDVHPRGSMSGQMHLSVPTWNSADSLADQAPCGAL